MTTREDDPLARRQAAMAICAGARAAELADALAALGAPAATDLRPPQTGLAMLRGRIGGDGGAFNLGEASVTRAAVRLESGESGFAYHLGRDAAKARAAAILDALLQRDPAPVEAALAPIARRIAQERAEEAAQVAATKVDFFTMVRGED
ncbi:phosphonate C-P lyase system protein PhnG [Salinarimonas sp.]|uniref:phosphonate C-P lyase system protein PhnG n=1 Tax=Salinarimonas sp. TaxID=2766526 RepID=UPI00391ACE7F